MSSRTDPDYIMYMALKGSKKLVEASTQTEDKPVDYWKRQVEAVTAHKTEGTRMGVRFRTKWQGYRIELYERSEVILAKGGAKILAAYLKKVEQKSKNRFHYMVENEPELVELLAQDEPAPGA